MGGWIARLGLRGPARPDPSQADALAFIAGHHGLNAQSRIAVARASSVTCLDGLCAQALSLGLRSRLVRLDAGSLNQLQLPCLIQHAQLGWMPLVAVHDEHLTVHHPQRGRVRLLRHAWAMEFKGLALEFQRAA